MSAAVRASGEALAGVAHDLGNAVVAIASFATRLRRRVHEDDLLAPESSGLDEAVTRCIALTRDLHVRIEAQRRDEGAAHEPADANEPDAPESVRIELRGVRDGASAILAAALRSIVMQLGGEVEVQAGTRRGATVVVYLAGAVRAGIE